MLILQDILIVIQDICACVCFVLVLYNIWRYKERSRTCTVITAAAAVVFSVANVLIYAFSGSTNDAFILMGVFSTLLPLIAPQIILKTKHHVKTTAILFTLQITVESLYSIVSNVIDTDPDSALSTVLELSCTIVGYLFVIALMAYCARNKELTTAKNALDTVPKWLYVIWFILVYTLYFNGSENDFSFPYSELVFKILFVLSAVGVLVCIVYFVYKLFAMSYQQTQILKQLNEQHANYENMLSSDQQLREFRHDYKNHMLVVTALLNAGKAEEASEYLERIKIQSGIAARQFSTGSFVADALLNNKNTLAFELGIEMSFSGTIPEKGIEAADLCTVIGNLTDNAIDGTKTLPGEKYIRVSSVFNSGFLVLTVENPVREKIEIKNNRVKTTKTDTKNHGIGLRNVEKIAEKYGGKLLLSCDDKEFTADISLKLTEE